MNKVYQRYITLVSGLELFDYKPIRRENYRLLIAVHNANQSTVRAVADVS